MSATEMRQFFVRQADACARLGSPLTAALLTGLAERIGDQTRTGQRILNWQAVSGDLVAEAVPLRLAGGLHALVRAGQLPELAALYPPQALPDPDALGQAAMAAIAEADDALQPWLDHAPQTNEVARAGVLYPGLMQIAARTGLPMTLWEVGASAGLNLNLDRFSYDFGGRQFGQADAPVRLVPDWSGPPPEGDAPQVLARRGCDLNPLDATTEAGAARLMAFIWPDQVARLERTEAAIAIACRHPPQLDRQDAADWIAQQLAAPVTGTARVLMHTVAFQYFPEAVQQRIEQLMQNAGATATTDNPLAWLSFEYGDDQQDSRKKTFNLVLRLWPGDGLPLYLATAHPHGAEIRWQPG
ncbi:DUF2332 domain-containing protein [Halovulum sp. GXIMD14793]